jgi:predicted transcriptional regulator/transcriptional regulator with XRE-family HTH domain
MTGPPRTKTFAGGRLRRLREDRGLTQVALARSLELSTSYLNQLEHDQRPLTVAVLLKVCSTLGVDVQYFSDEGEARLIAEVRDALSILPPEHSVSSSDLKALAGEMPAVARAIVALHGRYRDAIERTDVLSNRLGETDRTHLRLALPAPYEEVRDFFYRRHNYVEELERAAARTAAAAAVLPGEPAEALERRLATHGVRIVSHGDEDTDATRVYEPAQRILGLARHSSAGQRAFRMATQLAFLEHGSLLDELVRAAAFSSDETRALARIGLASYFAGAVLMPYGTFLEAAQSLKYDVDRLGLRFGVGFEPVCHRLSTLQRPSERGVPFFFVRVDRAGNVSKRQSATDFHFSRMGGTCPLWVVYEAFAQPGRILTQVARMPDDRTYFWIARTVSSGTTFGNPAKTFAIGLGCDLRHAGQLLYSRGLNVKDPATATPIGAGCKVCERERCPQRAFPPVGHRLAVDENESRFEPYPFI